MFNKVWQNYLHKQRLDVSTTSHALQPRQGEGVAHLTMSRRPQRQTEALKHHVVLYSISSASAVNNATLKGWAVTVPRVTCLACS